MSRLEEREGELLRDLTAANARIAELESAWQPKEMARKDSVIAKQEAHNDELKAGIAEMETSIDRIAGEVVRFTFIDESAFGASTPIRRLCEQINALKRIRDEWMEKHGSATETLGKDGGVIEAMHEKLATAQEYNRKYGDLCSERKERIAELEAQITAERAAHLETIESVKAAMSLARGRWNEWGGRAEEVRDALDEALESARARVAQEGGAR